MQLRHVFSRPEVWLQVVLILGASLFLSVDINRPLVDYDEATYAKVIVDTLESGNVMTFQMGENNWFEKPPLYLWLSMVSVKVFGEDEFSFRIPAIVASVLCCWLVYLITRELTGSQTAAALGFLVLLFSNSFYVFAKEARLDSAVIACILAALFFYLKARKDERYLLWVAPFIAVGFMFKSVIALLAIPIILLYCALYSDWRQIGSRYVWWGAGIAGVILVPWHLYESLKFGMTFWNDYLGRQVLTRAISPLTGTSNITDYAVLFFPWHAPWNLVIFVQVGVIGFLTRTKKLADSIALRDALVPLAVAAGIFVLFTMARTHLGPYIMPAFPFFALSIALSFHHLSQYVREKRDVKDFIEFLMFLCMIGAALFCLSLMSAKVPLYTYDERTIGQLYKQHRTTEAPLYALDWLVVETLNYYGDTRAQSINPAVIGGTTLRGPFYLVASPDGASFFFDSPDKPRYPGLQLLHLGKDYTLIYSPTDLQLPIFQFKP